MRLMFSPNTLGSEVAPVVQKEPTAESQVGDRGKNPFADLLGPAPEALAPGASVPSPVAVPESPVYSASVPSQVVVPDSPLH